MAQREGRELRVGAQRLDQRRLDGHEHQHEIQRVELGDLGVALLAEGRDVPADRGQVLLHQGRPIGLLVRGLVARPGIQRHLGVHHDGLALGQAQHQVGLHALATLGGHRDLGGILAPALQPRQLQQALELLLAPVALGLDVAGERVGQVARVVV